VARSPFDAAVALGTTRLVGRPIERKGIHTIALAGAILATIGAQRRPEYLNLMPALGTGEEVGVDLATGEEMRAREQRSLG
jgi:hypothetical protein